MGMMNIAIKNIDALEKQIKATKKRSEDVIAHTLQDVKSRAPASVNTAITAVYNIKKGDIRKCYKGAKKGPGKSKIRIRSIHLDNIQLIYKGKLLTPIHFGMKPGKPPARRLKERRLIPGQAIKTLNDVGPVATVKPIAPYQISAEIYKGKRKRISNDTTFLGSNGHGKYIPYERTGDNRLKIKALQTVSVPQMITNETVGADIQTKIEEVLIKRLEHHVDLVLSGK